MRGVRGVALWLLVLPLGGVLAGCEGHGDWAGCGAVCWFGHADCCGCDGWAAGWGTDCGAAAVRGFGFGLGLGCGLGGSIFSAVAAAAAAAGSGVGCSW